jgi:phosphoribosylformylglycinamidine cyclo-ligase
VLVQVKQESAAMSSHSGIGADTHVYETAPPVTTYRDAGVNVEAARVAVDRISRFAQATLGGGEAVGVRPLGHFGGTYRLPAGGDRVLVASADGVGTKLKLACVLGGPAHHRIGGDLVNHCVNDVLAMGARPLFFLDYVAMGHLESDTFERLVAGMAEACQANGVALIGGETAEMPGLYAPGEYDVAGFMVGEVAPTEVVDGSAVAIGDVLIGLPSGGLQTNGYSLARHILGLTGAPIVDQHLLARPLTNGAGASVGDALMQPHRSFLPAVQPLLARRFVRGMAHITGGGLIDNVPRMLPPSLAAAFDRTAWMTPAICEELVRLGSVAPAERYRVFNMGLGFVLAVAPADVAEALKILTSGAEADARIVGRVIERGGEERPVVRGLVDEMDGGDNDA